MTNLLGRRARGFYTGQSPTYDAKKPRDESNRYWADLPVDGEIVIVHGQGDTTMVYIWLLDDECRLRKCDAQTLVVLPRDHAGDLR